MISKDIYLTRIHNFEIGIAISSGYNMSGEKLFGLRINFFWIEFYAGIRYFPRF